MGERPEIVSGAYLSLFFASLSKFDSDTKNLHSGSSSSIRALEEQRRLLFVTATRARDELFVTGKYVAYGKKGQYTYNMFLQESFEANDQKFNIFNIQKEAEEIALEKKKKRAEERAKLAEQLKKAKEKSEEAALV